MALAHEIYCDILNHIQLSEGEKPERKQTNKQKQTATNTENKNNRKQQQQKQKLPRPPPKHEQSKIDSHTHFNLLPPVGTPRPALWGGNLISQSKF